MCSLSKLVQDITRVLYRTAICLIKGAITLNSSVFCEFELSNICSVLANIILKSPVPVYTSCPLLILALNIATCEFDLMRAIKTLYQKYSIGLASLENIENVSRQLSPPKQALL